jgi:hypothetical protein
MHGKILLQRVLLLWVGNGEDIRILKDKWIPDMHCLPVIPIIQMSDDPKCSYG